MKQRKKREQQKQRNRRTSRNRNGLIRRAAAVLLSASLAVSALPSGRILPLSQTAQAAGYGISSPTTDSDGVTTWDCVYFGNYWQNDTNGDGKADQNDQKEPIKWRVLSVDGDDAFLMADQNLDCKKYNETYTDVTWETCTLRSWLNGYGAGSNRNGKDYSADNFIDAAFTQTEQAAIDTASVINEDNPYHDTEGGNDTQDRIYLLSIAEASKASYGFPTEFRTESETRQSKNTEYAKKQGASTSSSAGYAGNGWWWLRSPGFDSDYASSVRCDGYGSSSGGGVNGYDVAVRPALHLHLSSDVWRGAGKVTSAGGSTGGEATAAPTPQGSAEPTGKPTPSAAAGDSSLSCRPELTVEVGRMGNVDACVYAETREEMVSLSDGAAWSSSDPSVAEVACGGFIHPMAPVSASGAQGSYSLWIDTGLVTVTGKKAGSAVVTGKLADGTSVRCDVTVTEPEGEDSSQEEGTGGSLEIGENQTGSASDGKNGVEKYFPASWSLKSTKYPVELSQKDNMDGTYTVKGTIGLGKSDILDQDTQWKKYKQACKKANEATGKYEQLEGYRELLVDNKPLIQSSGWTGKKKPSLSFMGYVEAKYDKYGRLISTDGKIAGDLKWKGDISWQFATPIGPMYLKLGAEGSASVEGTPIYHFKERKASLRDGKLTVKPAISLTGGYGIDKVASITANGKASVSAQVLPPSKGDFIGEASVNVFALFVVDYTWKLYQSKVPLWDTTDQNKPSTWTLYQSKVPLWDTTDQKKPSGKKGSSVQQKEGASFINTDFASEDTGWTGGQKARSQQEMLQLKDGLLPASLPMLASAGDTQVMVWQDYDGTRNVADSAVLMYSVCEDGGWSEPKAVCDDGYGDAFADLQVIDGKICLTWQKHKVKVSEEDAEEAMSQMAEKAEIYYAQFDRESGSFTNMTQVTDNALCDMMPKFVRGDDSVRIAWVRNDAGSMMQSEGVNAIYTSVWNGEEFDTEQMMAESPGTVERYVPYVQDGVAKAMYVTTANDIVAVQNSDNDVARGMGELMSMAGDGTVSAIDYAEGEIRLIRNGVLYAYDPAADKTVSYTAGDGFFDNTAVYCTNGTKSGYVWSAYDEETDRGSIMAAMSTDTGYSDPVAIYETDGEVSRYIAPVLTDKGDWNIALNQENMQSGVHSLSWLHQKEKKEISLVDASVSEYDVVDGMTGVEYIFTNTGDVAVNQPTLQITLADGTTIEKEVSVTAEPGETISGTAYLDLSKVDQSQKIQIALSVPGQDTVSVVSDELEQSDIALVGTATEEDGVITVVAYAENKGSRSAKTDFSLYGDADRQELFASQEGIAVAAGQKETVTFTVDKDQVKYNENDAAYLTLCADVEGGDYDMADNVAYLALYKGEKVDANTAEKGTENPSETSAPEPTATPKTTKKPSASQKPGTTTKPSATQRPGVSPDPSLTKKTPSSASLSVGDRFQDSSGAVYLVSKSGTSNGEAAYAAPAGKTVTSVVIPATVRYQEVTYRVTSIRANALKNCKKLKTVVIGKNIKKIGAKAFFGCKSLKKITIKTTKLKKSRVGTQAFRGIAGKALFRVPKKKKKAYRKLVRARGAGKMCRVR